MRPLVGLFRHSVVDPCRSTVDRAPAPQRQRMANGSFLTVNEYAAHFSHSAFPVALTPKPSRERRERERWLERAPLGFST